jgi:D-sedoheptulose 7-phosphate isomerase
MTTASIDQLISTLNNFRHLMPTVEFAAEKIKFTFESGNKILTAGNGGSAADALHLAEELIGRFEKNRRSLPAICLSADPTVLTCIANDYGYDNVFARQIEGLGKPGDLLIVFSTSGNSNNITHALETAKEKKMHSIALLGRNGGKANGIADISIVVPSESTARIQEIHTFVLHSWLENVERSF